MKKFFFAVACFILYAGVLAQTSSSYTPPSTGGGDSLYVQRSFADLYNEWDAKGLTPGRMYEFAFTTVYDQPDFWIDGPKDTVVTKTASIEHLVLTATSDSTFAEYVSSLEYPQDKIQYDISWTVTELMGAPAKGRISYRQDEYMNTADYDFRKVLYLRYESSPASGVFSEWRDNGNDAAEYLTFNGTSRTNHIGVFKELAGFLGSNFILSNIVFHDFALGNKIGNANRNFTFVSNCSALTTGDDSQDIITMLPNGDFAYNYIGAFTNGVRFQMGRENYFGEALTNCEFGFRCDSNSIWDAMTNFTAGNYFTRNIQYGVWSNSTVGERFRDGVVYGYTDSITAGNDCFKITMKSAHAIIMGNGVSNVDFGGTRHLYAGNNLNGIKNVTFGGSISGANWTNFITIPLHPEMYQTWTKQVILASDGNVYTRYFNGTSDVITIID